MNWLATAKNWLFGGGKKGVVEQVSDVVDKWNPSPVTQQKMNLEDLKAGDESQDSARRMTLPTHESWFDVFVDGMNRLPRPVITGWVICVLFGWVQPPEYNLSPMVWNIVWTVITFWFGARMVFKDLPTLIKSLRK